MKTRIIVDSSCDLPPADRARVHTVPLTICFGQQSYQDGVDLDHQQFYQLLTQTDALPTTSQPTPDAFAQQYAAARAAGEAAVVITISSKLSGTYQSAHIAAEEQDDLFLVDSRSGSIGGGILAQLALRLREEGLDAPAIAQRLEQVRDRIVVIALADTLEYLKRGGRISKTVAFAGGLLDLKPILSMVDGVISLSGKARGARMGTSLLARQLQAMGGADPSMPMLLGYTGLSDARLRQFIEDNRPLLGLDPDQEVCTSIGSTIGTHMGPGALLAAFFRPSTPF